MTRATLTEQEKDILLHNAAYVADALELLLADAKSGRRSAHTSYASDVLAAWVAGYRYGADEPLNPTYIELR